MGGATFQTTGTFTLNSNRGIALGAPYGYGFGGVDVMSGTVTYGGVIADGGTRASILTVSGQGTLALTGTNTYSGGTFIGGTLSIASRRGAGRDDYRLFRSSRMSISTAPWSWPLGSRANCPAPKYRGGS